MAFNPNNPLVFNEHNFQNVTDVASNSNFYKIFHIYVAICTSLASFSIGLLLFLIIKKTPKEFKNFSNVILICALTDLYVLIMDFLGQTVGEKLKI